MLWAAARRAYRQKPLAEALFGVRLGPIGSDDYYFDLTSFALLRRALKVVDADTRVVDLGAGAHAIVGLALWRRRGCPVISVEIDPALTALARESVARNDAAISVCCGSFFQCVEEPFDLVVFNPPYIPTESGLGEGLSETRRSQWDGGASGAEVIESFLDAALTLPHPFRVLMGVNRMHVSEERVVGEILARPTLDLIGCHQMPIIPAVIYDFARR